MSHTATCRRHTGTGHLCTQCQRDAAQASDGLLPRNPMLDAITTYTGIRPTDHQWRTWRRTGALTPRAWQHNGQTTRQWLDRRDPPLFRVGDVLDLTDP